MVRTLRAPGRRAGFSLVEMLVVIAIIGILVALLAGAVIHVMAVPPQKNTELTLKKVAALVNTQWQVAGNKARQDDFIPSGFEPAVAQDQRRADYVNAVYVRDFPDSFAAANNSAAPASGIAGNDYFQKALAGKTAGVPSQYESAICLYLILSVSKGGKTVDTDTLGSHEVGMTSTGLKFLKDGWGKPIQFTALPAGAPSYQPQFQSWGPDGTANTLDDLILNTFNGTAQNISP